jgi:nicotinamide-nucleotide amidase
MPLEIIRECSKFLIREGLTIAFAESATAGRVCSEFALADDAGKFLKGGLVCYDACIKEDLLSVPGELIKRYTPESEEVTEAAAVGLKKLIPADIHVAITGLTSPGGSETPEKPVGTVFIHGLKDQKMFSERCLFKGDKEAILVQTVERVAGLLLERLFFLY